MSHPLKALFQLFSISVDSNFESRNLIKELDHVREREREGGKEGEREKERGVRRRRGRERGRGREIAPHTLDNRRCRPEVKTHLRETDDRNALDFPSRLEAEGR